MMRVSLRNTLLVVLLTSGFSSTAIAATVGEGVYPQTSPLKVDSRGTYTDSEIVVDSEENTAIVESQSSYHPSRDSISDAAYASLAVYNGEENKLAWNRLVGNGYTLKQFVVEKNRVLWARKTEEDHVLNIIAIAGTESKAGLLIDKTTKLTDYENSKEQQVHAGYYNLSQQIVEAPEVQQILSETKSNTKNRVIVTGHSLGGATGIITALLLKDRGLVSNEQLETIVFGAPMIGNVAMTEKSKEIRYRACEMKDDIIPRIFQILHDKYREYLPNRFKWISHMPTIKYEHSMVVYIDEAERIRNHLLRDDEVTAQREGHYTNKELWIASPVIVDNVSLPVNVTTAYKKAVQHEALSVYPQSRVSYATTTLAEALGQAKSANYKYLLWMQLTFNKDIKSKNGNYFVAQSYYLYDVQTGRILTYTDHVITNGSYTLLENVIMYSKNDVARYKNFML